MTYRVWQHDDRGGWARLARRSATFDPIALALSRGERLEPCAERPIALDIHPHFGGALADSIPNSWNLTVINESLRGLVASSGSDLELLPAEVRDVHRRLVSTSYCVLNILTRHRCVDLSRSQYYPDFEVGQIADLVEAVLDESRIGAPNQLFRLDEAPTVVIVHEDLCRRIERAGATGVRFVPIEDYNRAWR